MRKLTVKNFSVIKEAELEFGKITVLIGPQSSGKSLLCKLAYFLGKELVELAVTAISSGNSWNTYIEAVGKAFFARFTQYSNKDWSLSDHWVSFNSFQYQVSMTWGEDPESLRFEFSDAFQQQFLLSLKDMYENVPSASGAFYPGGLSPSARQGDVWVALNRVLSGKVLEQVLYLPAGRAFFTNTSKGFSVLQNPGIDSITREFSAQIQWDGRWKVGLLTTGRGITDEISRSMTEIMQGFVIMDSGVPRFLTHDGRKLPLEIVSTGLQELIPLFNILEQLMFFREHSFGLSRANYDPPRLERPAESRPLLYLEEPEASVFPNTQYKLVQLLAWLSRDPILDFSWVITTHSPYIMTAFNGLLEASITAKARPDRADEIEKIIPAKYWVKQEDFRAYAFDGKDGILRSTMDEETGLINGDVLDSVSDTLGGDFERLLDIQYAER